jgi:hypothetical protein
MSPLDTSEDQTSKQEELHADRLVWVLAGIVCLAALFIRLLVYARTGWGMSDDALISVRIARNLASGGGFTYDLGSRIQSSSTPLWTLFSSGVWWLFGTKSLYVLPLIGLTADSLTAGAIVLLANIGLNEHPAGSLGDRGRISWFGPVASGCFYAGLSTTALIAPLGLETGVYTLTTTSILLLITLKRYRSAAILSGLAMLLRPDGVLLGLIVFGAALLGDPRMVPSVILLMAAIVAPYNLFALAYYGTLIPQTILAKTLIARSAWVEWKSFVDKFFLSSVKVWLPGALFIVGLMTILLKRHKLRSSMIWMVLYVAGFSTFAAWWPWYFPPAMIGYSVAVGVGLAVIISTIKFKPMVRGTISIGIMVCLFIALSVQTVSIARSTLPANKIYAQRELMAQWIDEHTTQDASVMLEPVGIVGYFSSRRFLDYPGLVSREVTDSLKELRRPISGKPDDPVVMAHLLRSVQPSILILREDEYNVNLAGGSLNDYRVVDVFPVNAEDSAINHSFQTMFVLARRGDNRVNA